MVDEITESVLSYHMVADFGHCRFVAFSHWRVVALGGENATTRQWPKSATTQTNV